MEILLWVLVFIFGVIVGFLLTHWMLKRNEYGGTIVVTRVDGKTVYSLVLDDYPEKIEFKKQILFKVETSDEDLIHRK